jgi:hypothetical protein
MGQPPRPAIKPKDPCGDRPDIPTNPLWHMGMARGGSQSSFSKLQKSVDWLTCQGKRGKSFDKDSKEFMHDLFEAFSTGGSMLGQPEAARLANHYVNGNGAKVVLGAYVYQSSIIVKDVSAAMKEMIASKRTDETRSYSLSSIDRPFRNSDLASPLKSRSRSQQAKGMLLENGVLLTEQINQRLKNADNRFFLQSQTTFLSSNKFLTRWLVESTYDFEPFRVGHVTDIPLGTGRILKVPDGLSEYLTHANIGVAAAFDYSASWFENWSA